MANYRQRRPALGWGGEKFAESAASVAGGGSWAGGVAGEDVSPGLASKFSVGGGDQHLAINSEVLFQWIPNTPPFRREGHYVLSKTGLTPGSRFGWRTGVQWIVDQDPSNAWITAETIGLTTKTWSVPHGGTIIVIDGYPDRIDEWLDVEVPPSGQVDIKVTFEQEPSNNTTVHFLDLQYGEVGTGTRPNLLVWGTPAGAGAPKTWPKMGRGSAVSPRFPSGRRSAWTKPGHDYLSMFVPYIPQEDRLRAGGPNGLDASGADGEAGWRAALEYGRDGGAFTYYPDQDDLELEPVDCVLVGPMRDRYDRSDPSLLRGVELVLRTLTPGDVFSEY